MKAFSRKTWKVIPCPRIYYSSSDVRISGKPDLAVQDSKRIRLVKLGVRKEKETTDMIRLMLRVMFQAAKPKLKLEEQDITYFDIRSGEAISGEASDGKLAIKIENGCKVLREMVTGKAA